MFYPSGRQHCVFGSTYKDSTRQITRQEASGDPSGMAGKTLAGHDINFDLNRIPKHRLHCRPRRQHRDPFEKFFVRRVISIKILYIRQVNRGLYDIIQCATGRFENLFDLSQRIQRLLLNRASHRLRRLWVHRPLSADVNPTIHLHGSRIRSRALFFIRMSNFLFWHGAFLAKGCAESKTKRLSIFDAYASRIDNAFSLHNSARNNVWHPPKSMLNTPSASFRGGCQNTQPITIFGLCHSIAACAQPPLWAENGMF